MDKTEWKFYRNLVGKYSPELGNSVYFMQKLGKSAYFTQKEKNEVLFQTTACITAPILFCYVVWVLADAIARKKERLYFLARDGCVMLQIAEVLCRSYQLPIECRYLYASRIAWRLPQYHLMKAECMEKICLNSIHLTLNKILERGALSKAEKQEIQSQLGLEKEEMEKVLCKKEIAYYKEILPKRTKLLDYVFLHSRESYQNTMGYLKQEGLLEGKPFAVVDIGWMGSMQESLECLLKSKDAAARVEGYYFGMLGSPSFDFHLANLDRKKYKKNPYHTWYFQAKKGIKRKLFFSHNLLECMCCAKDGMTTGYYFQQESGRYQPVFASGENLNMGKWDIELQMDTIRQFAQYAVRQIKTITEWEKRTNTKKMTEQLCRQFMVYPTKEQAEYYGRFLFSDDVTEQHMMELAPVMTEEQIRQNSVWNHIKNRVCPNQSVEIEVRSCWMEGTLARSGCKGKYWKILDVLFYKFLLFGILI